MAKKKEPWPVGRKIVGFRWLSKEEMQEMMWWGDGYILLLDDGGFLIPSSDAEGNAPGVVMGAPADENVKNLYPPGPGPSRR